MYVSICWGAHLADRAHGLWHSNQPPSSVCAARCNQLPRAVAVLVGEKGEQAGDLGGSNKFSTGQLVLLLGSQLAAVLALQGLKGLCVRWDPRCVEMKGLDAGDDPDGKDCRGGGNAQVAVQSWKGSRVLRRMQMSRELEIWIGHATR